MAWIFFHALSWLQQLRNPKIRVASLTDTVTLLVEGACLEMGHFCHTFTRFFHSLSDFIFTHLWWDNAFPPTCSSRLQGKDSTAE